MLQKIGKYRIIDQVGRGGMGTVYRAYDPVLDRTVALKVISGEGDVTDELRARFFREAQACARLSHPNIITVHDLGEEDQHLFIVMEYLEGEELKQLIAQRRPISLEAKLALMVQVCAGLDYAHQKGIVHRDIKPGNIFVLKSGAVKVLDFGIARIATATAGLTRTGLIMGTLRYMSPEQARGRVDHRSDIFSAGAVFYELLTNQLPFPGEDPMQILEQLRSEDPLPPAEVDPAIPAELSGAIQRALQKDPAQRFSSFAELRSVLDVVRRRLEDESGRVRARLRDQTQEVARLRQAVADRLGIEPAEESLAIVDDAAPSAAVEARCRALASEAERLAELVRRAEVLEPAYREALERLERGDAEGAAADLERLAESMPEHARAAAALARARDLAEDQRRERSRLRALLEDAELSFERGAYAECLAQLDSLASQPEAGGARERIDVLREAAAAALAAEEAARREAQRQALERARRARAAANEAREQAQRLDSPTLAGSLWSVAEAQLADAEGAMSREAYGPASKRLEEAGDLYRRAADAARREALRRTREKTQRAQAESDQARRRAQEARADELAAEAWTAAEAARAGAAAQLERESYALAAAELDRATELYRSAAEAAGREARRRIQDAARRARADMDRARRGAQGAGAVQLDSTSWGAAESRRAEGDAHLEAERWEEATSGFEQASRLYQRAAERAPQQAKRLARDRLQQASAAAEAARRDAEQAEAPALASALWSTAEATRAERGQADDPDATSEAVAEAARSLEVLAALYRKAAEAARQAARRRDEDLARAAQTQAADRRARAQAAGAAELAADAWQVAEGRWTAGQASLERQDLPEGARQLTEARDLYERAEEGARREEARRVRSEAQRARQQVEIHREQAERERAPDLAAEIWTAAEAERAEGRSSEAQGRYGAAARAFEQAAEQYRRAVEASRDEAQSRARRQAQEAHARVGEARGVAAGADAPGLAPDLWAAAEGKLAAGASALSRQMFTQADRQLAEALDLYQRATEAAREEARETARAASARAAERAEAARAEAERLRADVLAPEAWGTAEESWDSGRRAQADEAYDTAAARLDEAAELFEVATEVARREGMRRDRESLVRLQEEVRRARGRALEAGGPALAGANWTAAEARFADGRAATAMDAFVEGTGYFDEALDLYGRAETAARRARLAEEPRGEAGATTAPVTSSPASTPAPAGLPSPPGSEPSRPAAAPPEPAPMASAPVAMPSAPAEVPAAPAQPPWAPVAGRPGPVAAPSAPAGPQSAVSDPGQTVLVPPGGKAMAADATRVRPLPEPGTGRAATVGAAPVPRAKAGEDRRRSQRLRWIASAAAVLLLAAGAGWMFSWPPFAPPSLEAEANGLRQQVERTRAAAQRAEAEQLAPELFRGAAAAARAAAAAYDARDFARAAASYRKAEEGYLAALAGAAEALAQRALKQAAEARDAAERARAPRQAKERWAEAGLLERRGIEAFERRDYGGARPALDEATRAYQDALKLARAADEERDAEVRRARMAAAEARRDADKAQAPRHAPEKWADASGLVERAEEALKSKDFDAAGSGFTDAERAFREATALAITRSEEEQRRRDEARREQEARRGLAEQGREAAMSGREAAERAGADRHAPKLLEAARRRAQEAEAAFKRQDFERADQLFRQAGTEYRGAAEAAAQQLAALTREVDQLRGKVPASQEQALKAEASVLAKPQFEQAQARRAAAEQLATRGDVVGARTAYTDAIRLFDESMTRARVAQEDRGRANEARSRAESDRAKARRDSPEYALGAAEEKRAEALLQGLAFREAADGFREASRRYARAIPGSPPAQPPGAPRSPSDEVRDAIATYKRAYETKDVALLRRVVPGYTDADIGKIRDSLAHAERIQLDLSIEALRMTGANVAVASGRRREALERAGRTVYNEGPFSFTLVRTGQGWHIQSIK